MRMGESVDRVLTDYGNPRNTARSRSAILYSQPYPMENPKSSNQVIPGTYKQVGYTHPGAT